MNNKNLSTNPQAVGSTAGIAGGKRGGTSIFACSLPLLLENFQIVLVHSALVLCGVFFGGIFRSSPTAENIDDYCGFLKNCFANFNEVYLLLLVFVPLIASVTVMNFTQTGSRNCPAQPAAVQIPHF